LPERPACLANIAGVSVERRIAAHGGAVTAQRHGTAHYRAIGKAGARATSDKHGLAFWKVITARKGWHGHPVSLRADLAAGRVDAALAA
jgi:hypothetical protein